MYDVVVEKKIDAMGKTRTKNRVKLDHESHTLPSSPSHSFSSSSSSDFEFTISISPRKSSNTLCPADELFYKGQLLPLHLSPRISMVRTLLLSSSSTSSATSSTAPRDSTASTASNDSNSSFISSDLALFPDYSCDSSRPSSVTEDDEFKRLNPQNQNHHSNNNNKPSSQIKKTDKYFSLSRFSSVFRKDSTVAKTQTREAETVANNNSSVKRISVTAKEVIRKYFKKVKPLYEKLSQKQQQTEDDTNTDTTLTTSTTVMSLLAKTERSEKGSGCVKIGMKKQKDNVVNNVMLSHSFSGNLRYPRKRTCVSSCPSSMRSSPNHSGVLRSSAGFGDRDSSSMEELQSAIQGAITHCKNSLIQNNKTGLISSNEINLI